MFIISPMPKSTNKTSPNHTNNLPGMKRLDFLKQYILRCILDNKISFKEIVNSPGTALDRVIYTVKEDSKTVFVDLAKNGAVMLEEAASGFIQYGMNQIEGLGQEYARKGASAVDNFLGSLFSK